jgi:hypothetical protein
VKVATLACLAYSHFHLFLRLNKHLASQIFHEEEDVKIYGSTCLCAQEVDFYDIGIQNFVPRLNKYHQKVVIMSKKKLK